MVEDGTMTLALILGSWVSWTATTVGIGYLAQAFMPKWLSDGKTLRISLWIGVFITLISFLLLNFIAPLRGSAGVILIIALATTGVLGLVLMVIREGSRIQQGISQKMAMRNAFSIGLCGVAIGGLVLVGSYARGEPMDYDAGLYRLGLMNYAAEYPIIPGLANLHDRFGFGSFIGPMSAFMSNGLWIDNGYRLVTGLFMTWLTLDLCMRLFRSSRHTPGDYLTILGWGFIFWIVVTDSGRWIPSPAVDMIALVLVIAAFANFIDYLSGVQQAPAWAFLAILVSAMAGAVRPIYWLLIPLVAVIIALLTFLRRKSVANWARSCSFLVTPLILSSLLALIMLLRDLVLSGWLLFPLSLFPMPVDWITADPSSAREGITWYARAPGVSFEISQSDGWLQNWLMDFIRIRDMRFIGMLAGFAILPLAWTRGRAIWRRQGSNIILGTLPALILTILWFITAPDIRFGWGSLFALVGIPLAFLLSAGIYPRWFMQLMVLALLIFFLVTNIRNGRLETRGNEMQGFPSSILGVQIDLHLGPPNPVATQMGTLGDGTPVVYPVNGENCYMSFPLCLLPGGGSNIERRGSNITDGFRQIP